MALQPSYNLRTTPVGHPFFFLTSTSAVHAPFIYILCSVLAAVVTSPEQEALLPKAAQSTEFRQPYFRRAPAGGPGQHISGGSHEQNGNILRWHLHLSTTRVAWHWSSFAVLSVPFCTFYFPPTLA